MLSAFPHDIGKYVKITKPFFFLNFINCINMDVHPLLITGKNENMQIILFSNVIILNCIENLTYDFFVFFTKKNKNSFIW